MTGILPTRSYLSSRMMRSLDNTHSESYTAPNLKASFQAYDEVDVENIDWGGIGRANTFFFSSCPFIITVSKIDFLSFRK